MTTSIDPRDPVFQDEAYRALQVRREERRAAWEVAREAFLCVHPVPRGKGMVERLLEAREMRRL